MKIRISLLILITALTGIFLFGQQYPILPQLIIPQPVPSSTVEVLGQTGQPILVLTNTNPLKAYQVMIGATIEGDNRVQGNVNPLQKRPRKPINIAPGESLSLTGDDIINIFSNYSIFDINYSGIDLRELIQNQLFPEGTYRLCVQVYDFQTRDPLSSPAAGCSGPLVIRTPDPPIIINPRDRERVQYTDWQAITFRWTPVPLQQGMVQYRFRLAEVPSGVNPYDAINNDNLLRWEADQLVAPFFLYDSSLPPLPNGRYAIQVTAYDPLGQVAIKNEGRSDVVYFSLQKRLPEAPSLRFPYNASTVPQTVPQNYRFSWQAVRINGEALHHDLRIIRLPAGRNLQQAINDPNLLVDEVIGKRNGTYQHSSTRPQLEVGETYAWQVRAYDPNGEIEVENNGYSAIYTFTLGEMLLPAPELIIPAHNSLLSVSRPVSLQTEWRHETLSAINTAYRLSIWAYDGSSSPTLTAQSTSPIFQREGITSTTLEITEDELQLASEQRYIIQVQAYAVDSERSFENDGKSAIHEFEVEVLSAPNQVLDLTCGEGCRYTVSGGGTGVYHFVSGDTLRLGNFLIQLTDDTRRNTTVYSGEGIILPGPFFQSPIRVRLNALRFNAEGIAFSGYAEAILQPNLGLPSSWTGSLSSLRMPGNPGTTSESLERNSVPVSTRQAIPVSLPLEFNDAHITHLKLLPSTATAILVRLEEFAGNQASNNRYALFGRKGFCFSAAGPAMEASQSFLPLQNEVTVEQSENYSITLLRTAMGAPFGGTALPIDCEQANAIQAVGYVTIQPEHLLQNGQSLRSAPIYGAFQTSFNDWFDWQATLHLRTEGSRRNCCTEGDPVQLTLTQMPHIELEVKALHFDHSAYSNPADLQLPTGSNVGDDNLLQQFPALVHLWNGIYFKEASWLLPQFMQNEGGTNSKINARNLVLDDLGISGQTTVNTDEFGIRCQLKDWAARMYGTQIDVQQDQLVAANLNLGVQIPFLGRELPMIFENSWNGARTNWLVRLGAMESDDIRIPSWSADLSLRTNRSRIYALITGNGEDIFLNTELSGFLSFDERIGNIGKIQLEGIGVNGLQISNAKSEIPGIPHVSVASFQIPSGRILQIANYRVYLSNIEVRDTNPDVGSPAGSALIIDYNFKFDDLQSIGQAGIFGYAKLEILAVPVGDPVTFYRRHYARIDTAPIDWNPMDGIRANGDVVYNGNNTNPGFSGQMEIDLVEYRVRVNAQMGKVGIAPYWAFAGEVIPDEPIDLFCGLEAQSFGGGIYYNMNKPHVPGNGASVTSVNFTPPAPGTSRGNYGFMFSTVLLDSETTGDVFNGRFLLEVDMKNDGLEQIRLSGMSYLLEKELPASYWVDNHAPSPAAAFLVEGEIRFDWPARRLEALAGYRLNFDDGLLTGQGDEVVDILIDRRDWHIYLGQPGNWLNARLNIPGLTTNLDAYFMVEGKTNNWRRALETVQVGLAGGFNVSTSSYRVPLTRADRIKFTGYLDFALEGGLGFNTNFCSNHPPNSFFTYLGAGLDLGFATKYYESRRSLIPWPVVNDNWGWEEWFSWNFSIDMALYTPNPSGIRVGVGVDIPYWGWEDFSVNFGTRCQ